MVGTIDLNRPGDRRTIGTNGIRGSTLEGEL